MALVLFVGACGTIRDSRINPFNWFGRSAAVAAVEQDRGDGRVLVAQVQTFAVEQATGGAILRATGLPPTQGWWDGELVQVVDDTKPDTLTFRFVTRAPQIARRTGSAPSREITVARFVSNFQLEGVRRITVTAEGNARTVSRR